jgi:hypothetical protein
MDLIHMILGLAGFLVILAAAGAYADGWERRDARRRNGR